MLFRRQPGISDDIEHGAGMKPLKKHVDYSEKIDNVFATIGSHLSWECRRHVADMSARHSDVGGLRQKRHTNLCQLQPTSTSQLKRTS